MPNGQPGDQQVPPEAQSGETPPSGTPGDIPSGGFDPNGQGGMDLGLASGFSAFVTNGTVVTLTITDASEIEVEAEDGTKKAGSLSDLTKDSVLVLTMGADGAVTHILVRSGVQYLNLSVLLGMTGGGNKPN